MGVTGKMLNALRKDCWGCDNNICNRHEPCQCNTTKTQRQREKRAWKKEISNDDNND